MLRTNLLSRRYRFKRAILRLPNLSAYYPMSEVSGTTAYDYSINHNNGTITGTTTLAQPGPLGRCYDFDGTSSRISIADGVGNRFETNGTFSVIYVINVDVMGTPDNNVLPRIWSKRTSYSAIMGNNSNGKFQKVALEVAPDGGTPQAEHWANTQVLGSDTNYFVVQTYDNSRLVADGTNAKGLTYLNGSLQTTDVIGTWGGTIASSLGTPLYLGNSAGSDRTFDGKESHFAMLVDKSLTESEILKLARIGRFRP